RGARGPRCVDPVPLCWSGGRMRRGAVSQSLRSGGGCDLDRPRHVDATWRAPLTSRSAIPDHILQRPQLMGPTFPCQFNQCGGLAALARAAWHCARTEYEPYLIQTVLRDLMKQRSSSLNVTSATRVFFNTTLQFESRNAVFNGSNRGNALDLRRLRVRGTV